MRVVLDSNVLLIALGQRSRFKPIWIGFLEEQYEIVVSEDILYEYEEIIERRAVEGLADLIMEAISTAPNVIYKSIYYNWNAIPFDDEDNKFFDTAVAGHADYIVTNDTHFNEAKKIRFPKINIISADDFLNLLNVLK